MSVNTGDGPVIQGTQLIINCSVSVNSLVDTEFSVSISWSSQPGGMFDRQFVTISEITGSGHEFYITVAISPVNLTDSAIYTCTASVCPVNISTGVVASSEGQDSVNIVVEGDL